MATVPVEMTMVSGHKVTAAEWNSNVRDAVNFLLNPDAAQSYQSAAQSIPNGADTAVALDTNEINVNGMWATGANTKFTAANAGTYRCSGQVTFTSNANGLREAFFRVNGSTVLKRPVYSPPNTNTFTATAPAVRIHLNAGDYVELCAYQNSGGALNTYVASGATFALVEFASNA